MSIRFTNYQSISSDEIARIESELGINFPCDYRNFIQKYDGATPEENVFDEDDSINISKFIPVSQIGKKALAIEGIPEDALPFAEASSGNYLYLKKNNHFIWFWDHEIEDGDKELAANFREFMQKMMPFNVSSIQIQPGQVKSVWVDPDFKPEL